MNIKIVIFVLILIFLILFIFLKKSWEEKEIVKYSIGNKTYILKIARTPQEWQRGLMFIKKPVNFDGMIFIFPDKQIRTFWNKNTFVDLDIYWLDDDKIIGNDFMPSIEKTEEIYTVISPKPVNKVIEIIR